MNILPKKRWHVRTKENIARVRKDEAAAREEEGKRLKQKEIAESEARLKFLRQQAGVEETVTSANKIRTDEDTSTNLEHVDLFADYKSHIQTTNKDLAKEKKEEQEKYEKQIGYLTYLGQDTNEALKLRSWYELPPKRAEVGESITNEKDLKIKHLQDPLTLMNALLNNGKKEETINKKYATPTVKEIINEQLPEKQTTYISPLKKNKHKKEKKHKREKKCKKRHKRDTKERTIDKIKKLEKLREERLRREANERTRQENILSPKPTIVQMPPPSRIVQKYNSQFNPELAKQNIF